MSLHKSKGLTARLVVIAACVAGILPSIELRATIQEQARQREEQRRLFYVGLTRSTEALVISSAVQIPSGVGMQMGAPVLAGGHGVAILQASVSRGVGAASAQFNSWKCVARWSRLLVNRLGRLVWFPLR